MPRRTDTLSLTKQALIRARRDCQRIHRKLDVVKKHYASHYPLFACRVKVAGLIVDALDEYLDNTYNDLTSL
jgi:hypothetical protein